MRERIMGLCLPSGYSDAVHHRYIRYRLGKESGVRMKRFSKSIIRYEFEGTVSIHNSFFKFLFMKWKGLIAGSRIIYIQLFTTTAFTRLACYSTCNQCMHTDHRGSALSSLTCQLPSRMFHRTSERCNSASKTLVGSVEPFHVHKSMLSMVLAELSKSCSSY